MAERGGIDQFLAGAGVQRVGSFRFFYETSKWEWSDEVAVLHGYAPGEVEPTTELLAGHKHPDDRPRFEELVTKMLTAHTPFSSRHRIIDTNGAEHPVAVIAQTFADEHGVAIGTEGFYLDLGEFENSTVKQQVDEHVQSFREHSALIEQAKGMLMLVYGVSGERAFDVLRWRSQNENVKLHVLCRVIIDRATQLPIPEVTRQEFDHVILTAPH